MSDTVCTVYDVAENIGTTVNRPGDGPAAVPRLFGLEESHVAINCIVVVGVVAAGCIHGILDRVFVPVTRGVAPTS